MFPIKLETAKNNTSKETTKSHVSKVSVDHMLFNHIYIYIIYISLVCGKMQKTLLANLKSTLNSASYHELMKRTLLFVKQNRQ
mmetsp:Transcript_63305/g.93932  ORF Transcript_63305/g.93932 Transcript_63305/m.93932 type:complete len:83 (-) Transcript_63305:1337-1585(-)